MDHTNSRDSMFGGGEYSDAKANPSSKSHIPNASLTRNSKKGGIKSTKMKSIMPKSAGRGSVKRGSSGASKSGALKGGGAKGSKGWPL